MLDFKSICRMAIISLKINKMRSMLTSLGIIIGVSAVIIMLAVGSGASKKIAKDMESMGSNLLMYVQPQQNQAESEWEWGLVRH